MTSTSTTQLESKADDTITNSNSNTDKDNIQDLLTYFMGKNTKQRQDFIIDNLRVEEDIIDA